MDVIRDVLIKLFQILAWAALVPVIALIILAAINDRLRRTLLWILFPTTLVFVILYVMIQPSQPGTTDDWRSVFESFRITFFNTLPYLAVLALLGLSFYLSGPPIYEALQRKRHLIARSRYLQDLIHSNQTILKNFLVIDERVLTNLPNRVRLVGESGNGKSWMLRCLLAQQARLALEDPREPLPVLVDFDDVFPYLFSLPRQQSEAEAFLQGAIRKPRLLEALAPRLQSSTLNMLAQELRSDHLSLLIDSSLITFSPAWTTQGARDRALEELVLLVDSCDPARLYLALPPEVQFQALERLAPAEVFLSPLSSQGIEAALQRQVVGKNREQTSALVEAVLSGQVGWNVLAGRWMIIPMLVRYISSQSQLPANTRELMLQAIAAAQLPPERVESALVNLATKMLEMNLAVIPIEAAEKSLQHASLA